MLTYQNIIEFVDDHIPEFNKYKDDEELRENKMAYFTYLAIFIERQLGDEEVTRRVASLINEMAESTDIDVEILLDDFLLSLWTESQVHKLTLESLLNQLSTEAKESYFLNVQLWLQGNRT
jgi:hypothetical protein